MFLKRLVDRVSGESAGWTADHLAASDQSFSHSGPDNEEHAAVSKTSMLGLKHQYFEVTVVELSSEGCVAIGIGHKDFPSKDSFPGWRKGSYGYHSDDGHKYGGSEAKDGLAYAQPFGKGDTVGCGIHQGSIFFTLNGKHQGVAFRFGESMKQVFPIVALDYPSTVQINLGESPFAFNLQSLWQQAQGAQSDAEIIPLEILVDIFTYALYDADTLVSGNSIQSIALTCHWWKAALFGSCSNPLWKALAQKQWPYLCEMEVNVRNWARFYKTRMIALKDVAVTSNLSGRFLLPIESCERLTKEYNGEDLGGGIDDSGLEWERKCPLLLANIDGCDDEYTESFHCGVCNEQVYRVFTTEELLDRTLKGQCVLYFVGSKRPDEDGRYWRGEKMGKRRAPSARELAQKEYNGKVKMRMKEMRLQNRGKDAPITEMAVYEAKKEVMERVNQNWADKQKGKHTSTDGKPFKKLEFHEPKPVTIPRPKKGGKLSLS